jgi:hypothetical protein
MSNGPNNPQDLPAVNWRSAAEDLGAQPEPQKVVLPDWPGYRKNPPNEYLHPSGNRCGRLPRRSDPRALLLHRFAALDGKAPEEADYWRRRAPFALRSFGNRAHGDCTIASQALFAMRLERLEQRTRPAAITDEEVIRVYYALTERLYGGGDTGAYETDALDNWRRPELTFKDVHGRALTIDAYLRVNVADQDEVRRALWLAAGHGLKLCFNLPWAWAAVPEGGIWDVAPGGAPLIGDWMPGSWGGHSMTGRGYNAVGPIVLMSWDQPDQQLTWAAFAAYCDEAHIVIDSLDAWRTARDTRTAAKRLDLAGIRRAVNRISSQTVA